MPSLRKRVGAKGSTVTAQTRLSEIESLKKKRATAAKRDRKKFSTIAPSGEAIVGSALRKYASKKSKSPRTQQRMPDRVPTPAG